MFRRSIVVLGSTELASRLLLDRERTLSSKFGWGHYLGGLFDGGLMLRDFDEHRIHRGIMQAAFRGPARAGYHDTMDRQFAATVEGWAAAPGPMRFYSAIRRALIEQAGVAFLGLEPGPHIELASRCFDAIRTATMAVVRRNIPGTIWARGLRGRRELGALLRSHIPARREGDGRDLFSALCQAQDEHGERFDDEAIIDHLIFLLFAAHDTTTSALTTMIDELSLAPELQQRAAQECLAVRGDAPRSLGWDELDQFEFVDRCFREAIRLTPPVAYILRRTVRECPIGGHELPEGTPTTLVVNQVHRDPNIWTEPDRFDPDRFSPERGEDRQHPHAWVPFGGGAHRCIGAEFARQQVKLFCYHLFSRVRVERVRPGRTAWREVPIPMPKDGLPVRLIVQG
jgi:cytochrome P450